MLVVITHEFTEARVALMTVKKVDFATCLADATVSAVEVTLGHVIVKHVADFAEVLSKANAAVLAVLLRILDRQALVTLNFFDAL